MEVLAGLIFCIFVIWIMSVILDANKKKMPPPRRSYASEVLTMKEIWAMAGGGELPDYLEKRKAELEPYMKKAQKQEKLKENYEAKDYNTNRPATWDEFVGNKQAVDRLRKVIKYSKMNDEMPKNILFYGNAGCGKTSLAKIVANDIDATMFEITGSSLRNQIDLVKFILRVKEVTDVGDRAVIFIDEIHGIVEGAGLSEDVWLPILESGVLHHSCGGKCYRKDGLTEEIDDGPIYIDNVTWIGATTDPGMLHEAIRRRFPVSISMSRYTALDIFDIIRKFCNKHGLTSDPEAMMFLAERSRNRPAIATDHLMSTAMIEAGVMGSTHITIDLARRAVESAGIGEFGLKDEDLRVLRSLYSVYPKGLGAQSLAGMAALSPSIINSMVLPYLMELEWVITTHRRFLTEKGKKMIEKLNLFKLAA